MNGCEIVFSKPIGSGMSAYATWASGVGTNRCLGSRSIAAMTRSEIAPLPSSSSMRSAWMPITSTICRRRIAR